MKLKRRTWLRLGAAAVITGLGLTIGEATIATAVAMFLGGWLLGGAVKRDDD